ncbi:MAG: sigma-70 family RNA polymerase sigma factor [Gemmatimonadaceae bacterium]|nr:sigma-70 family RNA polymerase sigma factor [Gemmatimonadaceae bacterium]
MPSPRSRRPAHDELARLVHAAHGGDPAAVNAVLAAVRPWMVSYFARRSSPALAEDLAQLALIRIARSLPRIEPETADRYLMTVVRNLLRTHYRTRARDRDRTLPIELAEDVEAPATIERELDEAELARIVTPSEMAARAHLNPITVRTRLHRARTVLRRELWIRVDSFEHPDDEDDMHNTHEARDAHERRPPMRGTDS